MGIVGLLAAVLALFILPHLPLRVYTNLFTNSHASDWKFYGGRWDIDADEFRDLTGGRGDKAVFGSKRWTNYAVDTDLRFDSDPGAIHWGDTGIIVRVTDPAVGVDAYHGYYAGIGYDDQTLFIGRADYGWNRLVTAHLPAPLHMGQWYHLAVQVKGCYIEAKVNPLHTNQITTASFYDEACSQRTGAVGIRTFGVNASWKGFQVKPIK